MASQNDQGFKSFQASGALSAYIAVDIQADGTIKACANNVKGIGVTQEDATDTSYCNVKLWTAPGTHMIQVSGTALTPATSYGIITGGYVGVVTDARVKALSAAVASNGIIKEFAQV